MLQDYNVNLNICKYFIAPRYFMIMNNIFARLITYQRNYSVKNTQLMVSHYNMQQYGGKNTILANYETSQSGLQVSKNG